MNTRWLQAFAGCLAVLALPAQASFHLFRIDQVCSNADGNVQYVVMRGSSGANGENLWNQQQRETTNGDGVRKQFRFPSNLPSPSTAGRSVLIATPGFSALGLVTPDYVIPARFIPTDGGKLDFAGRTDEIALPATSGADIGACPAGTTPVYRVFNNRGDANHRYATDRAVRDLMVVRGGTAGGYGDDTVIMCAPPGQAPPP